MTTPVTSSAQAQARVPAPASQSASVQATTTAMQPASTPQQLNPLTLPLHGSRLIEASAGTGKTWTISALYVRLVLGHGLSLIHI